MSDTDTSLEQLLSHASPRPVPKASDIAAARAAVHAEWQAVTNKHRSGQKTFRYAVAATVLVALVVTFNAFRPSDVGLISVASIQKSFGAIYILGDESQLTRADDLLELHAGQTLVTGEDAGIALAWDLGGSVRLDKNTTVEFRDDNTIYLKSGQVYFDSTPSDLYSGISGGGRGTFEIETDLGLVSHVGTQFMTHVQADELTISVREGVVDVSGVYYPHTAAAGEQVVFRGSHRPEVLDFSGYGPAWEWAGLTAPPISVDGRSAHDFLTWVGRELGRELVYSNEQLELEARSAVLRGDIDSAPAEALNMRMATTGLEWRYDEGMIYVGSKE